MITFTIPGAPRGKGRPRYTGRGGFPRAYTDAKTRAYEQQVKEAYQRAGGPQYSGPVAVSITAIFEPPASLSQKKRTEMIGRYCGKKPDLDNIIKAILDGVNGVAFEDDTAVVVVTAQKIFGETAKAEVTISET